MLKFASSTVIRNVFVNFVKPPLAPTIQNNKLGFLTEFVRCTSFFNRLTGQQLWKGVTSVSNAGRRKGRARRSNKRLMKNLNYGQRFGAGKIRVIWPGLNSPVIKNKEVQVIKECKNEEQEAAVAAPIKVKRYNRIHPLDRGWAGRQQRGKKIGPPQPIQDETFQDFESIILEQKLTSKLTSVLGRKRTFFSIVATGNGNGVVGIGRAKGSDSKTVISLAKIRASKRLLVIDLIDSHTVNHDFFCEYGRTKIFAFKKPEGYGLRCHRVITALCQLIGIKNLHAKVEGPTNTVHMIRAFIIGLLRQKTYQEIADGSKLHLVEFRRDMNGFPRVLASPETCLTPKEALEKPVLFEEYIMDGKLLHRPGKRVPFYQKLPSWTTYLKKTLYHRNHEQVKMNLLAEYGAYKSHLTKVYPECRMNVPKNKEKSG